MARRGRRSRSDQSGQRGWLWWALGAVALVAGLGLSMAVRLLGVADDLQVSRDHLRRAGTLLEDGRISEARDALAAATTGLVRANGHLHDGVDVALLGWLPGISDNLDALRASTGLALRLSEGGRRTLLAAQPLEAEDGTLEVPMASGAIPVDAVVRSQTELDAVLAAMPAGEPGGGSLLLPPVREARQAVHDEALARRAQVANLSRGLGLLAEMAGAGGPRRYLIAVANTAEMRGSGGMILSYGVLESRDGDFELPAFGRIDEVALTGPLPPEVVPDLPRDYLARWEGFEPLERWRNANLAGDFTVVAPVLEAMYAASTGDKVDGVIQIDPSGLAAILEGTGPVEVPELGLVGADDVEQLVLHEAYIRYPGIEERSDVLEDVAEAAFDALVTGSYDSLRPLAEALVEAVDGRHIIFHGTSRASQQRARALGATGELPDLDGPPSVHLTIQNLAGNKLDWFLSSALSLRGRLHDREPGVLEATVALANNAPAGVTQPAYIYGPGPTDQPLPAGTLRSLVTLYLPFGTQLEDVQGDPLLEEAVTGTEDGRPYVSFTLDLPAREIRTVSLTLRLAPQPGGSELLAVPSPRVRPTDLSVHLETPDGPVVAEVPMDRTWRLRPGQEPTPHTGVR